MSLFHLRPYRSEDIREVLSVFRESITVTCAKDYSLQQRTAWLSGGEPERFDKRLQESFSLVALGDGKVVGFGNLAEGNRIDLLYVHPSFQRKGIASALLEALEEKAAGATEVEASMTALPFFLSHGYRLVVEQTVDRMGVALKNNRMRKERGAPSYRSPSFSSFR